MRSTRNKWYFINQDELTRQIDAAEKADRAAREAELQGKKWDISHINPKEDTTVYAVDRATQNDTLEKRVADGRAEFLAEQKQIDRELKKWEKQTADVLKGIL